MPSPEGAGGGSGRCTGWYAQERRSASVIVPFCVRCLGPVSADAVSFSAGRPAAISSAAGFSPGQAAPVAIQRTIAAIWSGVKVGAWVRVRIRVQVRGYG